MTGRSRRTQRASRTAERRRDATSTRAPNANDAIAVRAANDRWPLLDLVRGSAIVAMIVYHFCFDLAWNGWLVADFGEDWRWLGFRIPILGTFLFVAGASLAVAEARGQSDRHFWKRIAIVAGAAALVTLGSYLLFPDSFIYFGVLHAIAVMSVLARWLLPAGRLLIGIGLAILILGIAVRLPLFDLPALHWIGMMTFKPRTEDYVPLFPWFGVFVLGASTGAWLAAGGLPQARSAPIPRPLQWIGWLGRHSLAIYLVHQPLLLGTMMLAHKVV